MKKLLLPVLLFAVLLARSATSVSPLGLEDYWTRKTTLPVTVQEGIFVAAVHDKIYCIGGNGIMEMYDPALDSWTILASLPFVQANLPSPISSCSVAVYQNRIYIIGGSVNEVYDPANRTWQSKTPMPTARVRLQANVVGSKIYLIGGGDVTHSAKPSSSGVNEVYDPENDSWMTAAPMPTTEMDYVSTVVDNKIYVIGGSTSDLNQVYDTEKDSWRLSSAPPLTIATNVGAASAAATSGQLAPQRIYVVSSQGFVWQNATTNLNIVYDPKADSWANATALPSSILFYWLGMVNLNDELYVIGGNTDSAANVKYTPIGYGTVSASSPSPSPSPTPTLNSPATSLPAPLDSSNPILEQTPNETVTPNQTPTPTPNNTQENFTPILIITAIVVAAVVTLVVYFEKIRKPTVLKHD